MNSYYDAEYYESGLESGKSCYQNYRWVPELTIPMAMTLIDNLGIDRTDTILDFGCAKGYLVKAFRLLHRKAYGVDTSDYALENADPDIKAFCKPSLAQSIFPTWFNWVIAKDVFEHIEKERLSVVLPSLIGTNLFACIPLGENGKFRSPANDIDKSHVVCEDEDWWISMFHNHGWEVKKFTFRIDGIKDHYYATSPESHGFFFCKKKHIPQEIKDWGLA